MTVCWKVIAPSSRLEEYFDEAEEREGVISSEVLGMVMLTVLPPAAIILTACTPPAYDQAG